jgi:xylan 1,4-beta-xylosidase
MNPQGIRKPAWFAYKYLNAVRGRELACADPHVFAAARDGGVTALIYDWSQPRQAVSNRPFYTRLHPASAATPAGLRVTGLKPGAYRVQVRRTGFRSNDAYSAYIEMGSPKTLSDVQVAQLQALTRDRPERDSRVHVAGDGAFSLSLPLRENDIVLVQLSPL